MIGIYALTWEDQGLIYIGQTTKTNRYQQHCYEMIKGIHTNHKIQNAYNNYGLPKLLVLEETEDISKLDSMEESWINEFNSVEDGLNIRYGGPNGVGRGIQASGAKHSKRNILRVFSLLYRTTLPYLEISKKTGVPKPTIAKLAASNSHLWLLEQYPKQYSLMLERISERRIINKKGGYNNTRIYPTLLDPNGNELNISNLFQYCRDNKLNKSSAGALSEVMRGIRKQHLGYTLKDISSTIEYVTNNYILVSPAGEKYTNLLNISKFCREQDTLNHPTAAANLARVIRGEQNEYLGWTIN
jgi:predicted GIY-YIG superfamily endonuclease